MSKAFVFALLFFVSSLPVHAQIPKDGTAGLKEGDPVWSLLAQTEEVAMCHHAIIAAHYEAKSIGMGQNPVFRYILDSDSSRVAIYPSPERCRYQMTYFLVRFNDEATGADLRKAVSEKTRLSAQELVTDSGFLDMVIRKKTMEKDRAGADPDSNIPGDPWVYKLK